MLHRSRATTMQIAMLLVLCAGTAMAAWLPVAGGEVGTPAQVVVNAVADDVVDVTVTVPGVDLRPEVVDGQAMVEVFLSGAAPLLHAGAPELPVLAQAIRMPAYGSPQLQVVEARWQVISKQAPVPSRGPLTRAVDPRLIPRRPGPMYANDGVYPTAVAELGRPFLVRDHRGVALHVHPVRWDAGRGELLALSHLTLRITIAGDAGANCSNQTLTPAPRAFAPVLGAVFGPDAEKSDDDDGQGYGQSERMLLVTTNAMRSVVDDLAAWKRQCGHLVDVVTMEDVGGSVLNLMNTIRSRYESTEGLAYLLLVGDVSQVPTQTGSYNGADSDGIYGLLSGDDLYVDVLVSRLPARNAGEARLMIDRTVAYERDVNTGAAWCARAAGIASDEGSPADYERAEELRDELLTAGLTDVARIYQGFGGDRSAITTTLDDGVGLVNYLGHGSGTGWLSVPFGNADVHDLANTTAWPWIIDVSCSNGDFSLDECFAEAWLRSSHDGAPAGAVAMLSASTATSWVPPCVMQATMIDELTQNGETELGALYAAGVAAVLVQYEGVGQDQKLMEQYNLFGDASLRVRLHQPQDLSVSHPSWIPADTASWPVEAPAGARVVLTVGEDRLARADIDGSGSVELTLSRSLVSGESVTLTIAADDAVVYQASVPVQSEPTPVDEVVPAATTLLANYPNPFNPSTTVAFSLGEAGPARLSIMDVRGRLITTLVDDDLAAGRHDVQWRGLDAEGRSVSTGTYLAVLKTATTTQARRLTLVK